MMQVVGAELRVEGINLQELQGASERLSKVGPPAQVAPRRADECVGAPDPPHGTGPGPA